MNIRHSVCLFVTTIFCVVSQSQTALAQSFEPTWQLNLDLVFVNPTGDAVIVDVGTAGVDVDFDSKVGAGLRGEYQFSEALSVEIGAFAASSFGVTVGDIGNNVGVATKVSSIAPFTVGLNYHFTRDSSIDLYAGPFLSYARYGDIGTEVGTGGVGTNVAVDNDVGWGAVVGLGIPIGGKGWSVQSSIRFIDTEIKGVSDGDPFDSEFDPTVFSLNRSG